MEDFSSFVKKNDGEIQAKREAKRVKEAEEKEYSSNIQSLAPLEWAKVLPMVLEITKGEVLDGKQFLTTSAGSGVMLGGIHLGLSRHYKNGQYVAEYRGLSGLESRELSSVTITPSLSGTSILWNATGVNKTGPLATLQLAEALAMKLVEIYQAHQI